MCIASKMCYFLFTGICLTTSTNHAIPLNKYFDNKYLTSASNSVEANLKQTVAQLSDTNKESVLQYAKSLLPGTSGTSARQLDETIVAEKETEETRGEKRSSEENSKDAKEYYLRWHCPACI
jgi:ribosomal protein L12E/L44/L45/RPP1/RPP2